MGEEQSNWVMECPACGVVEGHDSWYGAMEGLARHCWESHSEGDKEEEWVKRLSIVVRRGQPAA